MADDDAKRRKDELMRLVVTQNLSVSVAQDLVRAGAVDEYRLFVHPAVAGSGRRLFDGSSPAGLRLDDARPFASGVVLLRYVPSA